MDPRALRDLLEQVASGRAGVDDAVQRLRDLPYADLGYAHVDNHRALRVGVPEVIFGAGKSLEHMTGIVAELDRQGHNVLITRLEPDKAEGLQRNHPDLDYNEVARTGVLCRGEIEVQGRGTVCIVSAGTSDIPVAEEAAVTARVLGNKVEQLFDVGVAGVHRLLGRREVLDAASVIVVVAGMEGALASVVGVLVDKPVIAVPTSIGYGASFGGIAALLAMLNSCASGVTVVNIDNGFGAAYAATLINRKVEG